MKAATVNNGKIAISEVDAPSIKFNEKGAIIKIIGCGLCGSDIVKFKNGMPNGTVLGHEIVGEIVEINTDTDFKRGDKIVMGHHVPCMKCKYCLGGNYSMCRHFKQTNIIPGGFSEYIFASEEHLKNTVFAINDGIEEITASFMEPLGCCIRSIKRANLNENSTVAVIGLGSIGLIMGQALKAYSHTVIGCDLLDDRLAIAQKVHFDKVINSKNADEAESRIRNLTAGLGVDAVFMTSGAYQTIPSALKIVRDGGKIVVFSSVKSLNGYANNEIYYRELTVLGSYSPSPEDLKDSLEMLKSKKVLVNNFSVVYNLESIEKAFEDTINNRILKAYIQI